MITRKALYWLGLFVLLWAAVPNTAVSQTTPPETSAFYWQHQTSGRIQTITPVDINTDGVDELIITDSNGKIDLLFADGALVWSHNAPTAVSAIAPIANHTDTTETAFAITYNNTLALLDPTGTPQWTTTLTEVPIPAALYTNGSLEDTARWRAQYPAHPIALAAIDYNQDGQDEILILMQSGQLQLYDQTGQQIWSFVRNTTPFADAQPHMLVADFNQDGQDEIALGFFNTRRFSQLILLNGRKQVLWDRPVEGRISAMTAVHFRSTPNSHIAIGTNLGQLVLFDSSGQKSMPRTVNRPITALTALTLTNGNALAVGTDVGKIVVYTEDGRRAWTHYLSANANQRVVAMTHAGPAARITEPVLSVVYTANNSDGQSFSVDLLGNDGRKLDTLPGGDSTGLSRLIDINHDGVSEMLIGRFATVALTGLGIGVSEIARDWPLALDAPPTAFLVVDFDQDGEDEVLVGAEDGRIHRLTNDGRYRWIVETTGAITHLAALPHTTLTNAPDIVAIRSESRIDLDSEAVTQSWISLYQANSQLVWETELPTKITALYIADINNRGRADIIVGTEDGRILIYSANGQKLGEFDTTEALAIYRQNQSTPCSQTVDSPSFNVLRPVECAPYTPPAAGQPALPADTAVTSLFLLDTQPQKRLLIAATTHTIFQINQTLSVLATFPHQITGLHPLNHRQGTMSPAMLATLDSGEIVGLSETGVPLPNWPQLTNGIVRSMKTTREAAEIFELQEETAETFLFITDKNQVQYLTVDNNVPYLGWRITSISPVTGLTWGDLDGDSFANLAIGTEDGKVFLFSGVQTAVPQLTVELDTLSRVSGMTALHRRGDTKSDLLTISNNGLVQMYRAQENRPPLLVNPAIDITQGQYTITVSVLDVENDTVNVTLEIYNPQSQQWLSQGQKTATGHQNLFWPVVTLPSEINEVRYRFIFDDTFHTGTFSPPPGPRPLLTSSPAETTAILLGSFIFAGIITLLILLRQNQSPVVQARRFYRQLQQHPHQTLPLLQAQYAHTNGSPDFLISLAGQARQQANTITASLADGLFLLADRPHTGLSIILTAFQEIARVEPPWAEWERWHDLYTTVYALLEAPSITELSLLHPQLQQHLTHTASDNSLFQPLLPILSNLRDSERVDPIEDKLVYLNEAVHLMQQFEFRLAETPPTIERMLAQAVVRRWLGLASVQAEELRGRAELVIELLTRRVIPNERILIALQIHNNGRSPAENITASLQETAAYRVHSQPEKISLLPPGRQRQITFMVEPLVPDRFRIGLTITYNDHNYQQKTEAYGDMVSLLPPTKEFTPIPNPYLPGTPLRKNNPLFVGREELFAFIANSAGQLARQKVLILVGQRRTGKTSVLLRLPQHLPDTIIPVYIDCQSLGVMPGMPMLFYDMAWLIADALADKEIHIDVPEVEAWQANPTQLFQREFLPMVFSHLPPTSKLLLVFDEFEAFENLVEDNILPSTFFPYLRHLMQHSERLGFVFVGTRRLEEMTADYWSVLFNIALYQKIGYLSETAATRLITEPVADYLIYDDLAIDKILRVTAGHPYFLQLVCYTLVRHANTHRHTYVTISDVNTALDEMLRLGEVHFAYLWQRSTYTEKALLLAFAHLAEEDVAFRPEELVSYLEIYGINLSPTEVTAALHSLVERDIAREVVHGSTTLYEQHVGLVGLWVSRHKSLAKLHMAENSQEGDKVTG